MDLPLLRKLQAMKRVEDEPSRYFKTKTIDSATFVPMYPNVIIVDQSIDESVLKNGFHFTRTKRLYDISSEGPVQSEIYCRRLSVALMLKNAYEDGTTIILKEGLYIVANSRYHWGFAASVEIVGLKDVRLLFAENYTHERAIVVHSRSGNLTLRNVRIYDHREDRPGNVTIKVAMGANAALLNVCIHAPSCTALYVLEGSFASMKDSAFIECRKPALFEKSELLMETSSMEIYDEKFVSVHSSKLIAKHSRLAGYGAYMLLGLFDKSQCLLEHCRLEHIRHIRESSCGGSIFVFNESNLTCHRSLFHGGGVALAVNGSKCNAVLDTCVLSSTEDIAGVFDNASLTVSDCNIDTSTSLLKIGNIVKGNVQFVRNQISDTTPRIVMTDKVSENRFQMQDIDDVTVLVNTEHATSLLTSPYSSQERSRYTKTMKQRAQQLGTTFDHLTLDGDLFKKCARCDAFEDERAMNQWCGGQSADATEKFRYCGRCQSAAYCSKECKDAHWVDHRLVCKKKSPT